MNIFKKKKTPTWEDFHKWAEKTFDDPVDIKVAVKEDALLLMRWSLIRRAVIIACMGFSFGVFATFSSGTHDRVDLMISGCFLIFLLSLLLYSIRKHRHYHNTIKAWNAIFRCSINLK